MTIPLTLHFQTNCEVGVETTTSSYDFVKVFTIQDPATNITGINSVTTIDNLPHPPENLSRVRIGDVVVARISPDSLSSYGGGTLVKTSDFITTPGYRKITFSSNAPSTATPATELIYGAWYPAVTVTNGKFTFSTDIPVIVGSLIDLTFVEPRSSIIRTFKRLKIESVTTQGAIYTATTQKQNQATQNDNIYDILTFKMTAFVYTPLPTATSSFTYNIPQWIADVPCRVTPHSFISTSSGKWIGYLNGITQSHTTELVGPSTQNNLSTRFGLFPSENDIPPFFGFLKSGTQVFTLTLQKVTEPTTDETTVTVGFSLTFTPL